MDFPNPRNESFQAEAEGRGLRNDSARGFGKSIFNRADVCQWYSHICMLSEKNSWNWRNCTEILHLKSISVAPGMRKFCFRTAGITVSVRKHKFPFKNLLSILYGNTIWSSKSQYISTKFPLNQVLHSKNTVNRFHEIFSHSASQFHSVEKSSKTRSPFVWENQHFFRQINVY